MNSSTKKRVYSALGILALLAFLIFLGRSATLLFIYFCGFLICDEFITNFLKISRDEKSYLFGALIYVVLITVTLLMSQTYFPEFLVFLNLVFCCFQLMFLFEWRKYSVSALRYLKKMRFISIFFIFLPIHSLARILYEDNWQIKLLGILLLVALTDSAAWFFGRKFGKSPLWPSVSPKKTREGAFSGVMIGAFLMYIYGYFFLELKGSYSILTFMMLCSLAVLGDLVQSKLKRRFSLKDSSSLIPGHGGVYDRTDSILFIAPFYLIFAI